MRILFLGFGITPYYRDFLNKLNSVNGISIDNIRPSGTNRNLGEGVHQDFAEIRFNDIQLPDVEIPPRRLINHPDFELRAAYETFVGLKDVLLRQSPDVVVVNVVYHPIFHYDRVLAKTIRSIGSKVIYHSIPFGLQSLTDRRAATPEQVRLRLSRFPLLGEFVRVLGADRLYLNTIRKRALELPLSAKQKICRYPDAHAIYHEAGIPVYTSYGVPTEKIHVVRNSPNTEKLIDAANKHVKVQRGNRLLHIGRLVAWKRVDLLISAFAALKSNGFPQLELTIIGYGPCQSDLEALAKQLKVDDSIYFAGGIYDPELLAAEAMQSSVYVLAGMGGLSINEAMCFGLPIICSRGDGTEKFLVRHSVNGFFFREGDLRDLTAKIGTLLADNELRKSMGEASRKIIDNELNSRVHVNNYLTLFEKLTGRRLGRYIGTKGEVHSSMDIRTA